MFLILINDGIEQHKPILKDIKMHFDNNSHVYFENMKKNKPKITMFQYPPS